MTELVPLLQEFQANYGVMTVIAPDKETLYEFFDHLVVELILNTSISVLESRKLINKSKYIHLLRQRQASILYEFENLYYYRPISVYQIALIIESIEEVEPILIPNFLLPFKEEGVTEIEKREQYDVLKKRIFQKSETSPVIIGCRLDWLEEIEWLYKDLEENTKTYFLESIKKLPSDERDKTQQTLF